MLFTLKLGGDKQRRTCIVSGFGQYIYKQTLSSKLKPIFVIVKVRHIYLDCFPGQLVAQLSRRTRARRAHTDKFMHSCTHQLETVVHRYDQTLIHSHSYSSYTYPCTHPRARDRAGARARATSTATATATATAPAPPIRVHARPQSYPHACVHAMRTTLPRSRACCTRSFVTRPPSLDCEGVGGFLWCSGMWCSRMWGFKLINY